MDGPYGAVWIPGAVMERVDEAVDSEHVSVFVEGFGDAVCVEDEGVAWLEGERGFVE